MKGDKEHPVMVLQAATLLTWPKESQVNYVVMVEQPDPRDLPNALRPSLAQELL